MGSKRTIKKEIFAHKYVETGNASEAYRFAYNTARMKPESVRRMASELLKDLYVTSTVERLQKELMAKLDLSAESVIKEYKRIAFLDPRRIFHGNNAIKNLYELEIEVAAAIANIEIVEASEGSGASAGFYIKKIRFNDKLKALEALAKHLGLFNKNNQNESLKVVVVKDFTGAENR